MSKFGELLDEKIPILLAFFRSQESESQDMNPVLKDVAAALGDKGKVIKIKIKGTSIRKTVRKNWNYNYILLLFVHTFPRQKHV